MYPAEQSGVFSDQNQVLLEGPTAGRDMKRGLEQRFHGEVAMGRFLLSVPGVVTCGWDAAVLWLRKPCGQNPSILGSKKRTKLEPRVLPALCFSESPGTSPLEAEWKGQSSIVPSNMENHTSLYIQQETVANNPRNQMTGLEDITLELSRHVFPGSRPHVHGVPGVFLGSATMEIQGKPWGKAA